MEEEQAVAGRGRPTAEVLKERPLGAEDLDGAGGQSAEPGEAARPGQQSGGQLRPEQRRQVGGPARKGRLDRFGDAVVGRADLLDQPLQGGSAFEERGIDFGPGGGRVPRITGGGPARSSW